MMPTVQSLWIGGELSALERLCIRSFLQNGHGFDLYVYDEVRHVPDGVNVIDANRILPRKEVFTFFGGSYAGFADWFRYELLFREGGYWVDMDMVCLRPFDFDDDLVFGWQDSRLVAVGVLKLPRGHALPRALADRCRHPNRVLPGDGPRTTAKKILRYLLGNRRDRVGWGEGGGPAGFTATLRAMDLLRLARPFPGFYPVQPRCWRSLFDDTFRDNMGFFSGSHAVHLWNEAIRRDKAFDKNGTFSQGSAVEAWKRRYL